jgi:hypothetical protein
VEVAMLEKIIYKLQLWIVGLQVKWQLKFKTFKLRCSHMKIVKHELKILRFCVCNIIKIGIPISETDNESIKQLSALYDETLKKLNGDVDKIRSYVWD